MEQNNHTHPDAFDPAILALIDSNNEVNRRLAHELLIGKGCSDSTAKGIILRRVCQGLRNQTGLNIDLLLDIVWSCSLFLHLSKYELIVTGKFVEILRIAIRFSNTTLCSIEYAIRIVGKDMMRP